MLLPFRGFSTPWSHSPLWWGRWVAEVEPPLPVRLPAEVAPLREDENEKDKDTPWPHLQSKAGRNNLHNGREGLWQRSPPFPISLRLRADPPCTQWTAFLSEDKPTHGPVGRLPSNTVTTLLRGQSIIRNCGHGRLWRPPLTVKRIASRRHAPSRRQRHARARPKRSCRIDSPQNVCFESQKARHSSRGSPLKASGFNGYHSRTR